MSGPRSDQPGKPGTPARGYQPPQHTRPVTGATAAPPSPPEDLLERHGAKVLRPGRAAPTADGAPVQPTVYRAGTMLVETADFADPEFRDFLRRTVNDAGLRWGEGDE